MLRRSTRRVAVAAVVVAAALVGVGLADDRWTETAAAAEPTEIQGCAVIDEPGVYVLTSDITGGGGGGNFTFASESCIRIGASDVVLRGQGHLIDGRGISDTTAITASSATPLRNVTVRNVALTDWNRGVYLDNAVNAEVRNVRAEGTSYGLFVENSRETTIRSVAVDGAFIGVYLGNTSDTTLANNTFSGVHTENVARG